jgi:hypothetical protein
MFASFRLRVIEILPLLLVTVGQLFVLVIALDIVVFDNLGWFPFYNLLSFPGLKLGATAILV